MDTQDKQIEENLILIDQKLQAMLDEKYNQGLRVGVSSVSKVILDKLNDSSKPLIKRIEAVKRFCEIPLNKQRMIDAALKEAKQKADLASETLVEEDN